MSNKFFVGRDITSFSNNGKFKPVSRVTLLLDDENSVTSGDDTGLELVASCRYGTQKMTDNLLAQFAGYQYQAFEAGEAEIDPAAELGDGVTVNGIYGIIAQMSDDGNGFPSLSAPGKAEMEDEYPVEGPITKEFNRKIAQAYSLIEKTAEEIRTEVAALDRTWEGNIEEFEDQFDGKLENLSGDIEVKFSNYSTTKQTAELISTEVRSYLYVKDENGNITEQEKYSTTEQTAESISAAINGLDGKYLKVGIFADGMFVEDENGNYTQINGTKIQSETISGDKIIAGASISAPEISGGTITGGTISGGTITGAKLILGTPATDVTTLNDPAIHFVPKSDESPFGSIYYEYKASPSETESAHNLWITTREYKGIMATEPYGSIKIRSGYRMSLEAQVSIYINGGNQGTVFGGIVDFTNATVTGLTASSATAVFG